MKVSNKKKGIAIEFLIEEIKDLRQEIKELKQENKNLSLENRLLYNELSELRAQRYNEIQWPKTTPDILGGPTVTWVSGPEYEPTRYIY